MGLSLPRFALELLLPKLRFWGDSSGSGAFEVVKSKGKMESWCLGVMTPWFIAQTGRRCQFHGVSARLKTPVFGS